jgi:hypothetical protein
MAKIKREVAEAEVESWLDKKKVFQETRDRYKDHIEIMIEAIMNGVLFLNQDSFEWTHSLLFPLGDDGKEQITELKYRCRVNEKLVLPHTRGLKSDDADGRFNALIAAVTSESKGVIVSLDSADKRIATSIGVFFA